MVLTTRVLKTLFTNNEIFCRKMFVNCVFKFYKKSETF